MTDNTINAPAAAEAPANAGIAEFSMQAAPVENASAESAESVQPVAEEVAESWTSSLPEELRKEAGLAKFKDISGLAKSYLEAEKRISGSVKLPTEKSTPEEVAAFYAKLGRPESADKYAVELSTGENAQTPQIAALLTTAFDAGLTQKQTDAVLKYYDKLVSDYSEQSVKHAEAARETLQKEWGKDFDANMNFANVALHKFGEKYPAEMSRLSRDPAFANNPVILSLFSELGSRMQEGRSVSNESPIGFSTEKTNALQAIDAIKKDPKHAYWNAGHPNHFAAKREVDELYKRAYS